ncbi:hypothetical protein [Micromonospora sp. NPDC048898]|uniref:hypothetical protein n=1 Tax=Micromonospora sp. NPDC048898 TaxID=3364260 RepID=UPI00371EB74A
MTEAPVAKEAREKPYRTLTTQKFALAAGTVFLLGVYCLYLGGEETSFWRSNQSLRTLMEQLGGLLIVSSLLSTLWELVGKRAFAQEVLEDMRISAEIEASGLKRISTQFFDDAAWEQCFKGVEKLDIFAAYAQTWRNMNLARLQKVAARSKGRIRIYLADPEDAPTMVTLSNRFGTEPEELRRRIWATKEGFEELRVSGGASVEVFFWPGDRVYTFYRFDNRAIMSMYKHNKGRSPILPTIMCESGGSLFQFVYDELRAIRDESRPVSPALRNPATVTQATRGTEQ